MAEIAVKLQQTKAARVLVLEGVELQFLRVVQRPADPLAVTEPHGEAVGVVNLRVDGVAHPALVVAAAEHTGHRRDAQLFDIFAGVDVVFDIHNHLRLLAVDHKFIGAGDARAVEQRVNGKDGGARLDGFKPERGKVRELFRGVGKGIHCQTAGGEPVLVGAVHRAEVARAEERHDIATRQLRRFKRAETGKTEVGLPYQLFGVYAGVIVVKQFRTEVNLPRLLSLRIQREHAHAAAKTHADVEKLDVQLAVVDVIPQRMSRIVLNAVVGLRSQIGQRGRQVARGAAPRLTRQIVGHRLQNGKVKTARHPISNARFLGKRGVRKK